MIRVAFIIGDYPPEERRLREEVARSFSTAEVEVGILSVKPSPFGGLSPAEIHSVSNDETRTPLIESSLNGVPTEFTISKTPGTAVAYGLVS